MSDIQLDVSRRCLELDDHPALYVKDRTVTYAEYDRLITAASDFLITHKMTDRIAIVSHNRIEYVIAVWAIMRSGGIACLINARLPESAVRGHLREIGCTSVLQLAADDGFPTGHRLTLSQLPPLESLSALSDSPTILSLDRPATVMLTSGTAGKPRAIAHSVGNHYYSALGSNENIEVLPGDTWLLSLPLYHVGGLSILFRCLLGGGAVEIPDGPIESSLSERVTHLSVVPTQLHRILEDSGLTRRLSSQAKAILVGGAAVSPEVVGRAIDAGLPIHTSYGLTEMSSQVTTTPPGDSCTSSGRLLPYRQLRLTDDLEIEVRGETRFWGTVESGALVPIDPLDWFATGDIGRFDENDMLEVVGRVDSRFKSGGEIVQPELVEDVLRKVDGVVDALVVGIPDDDFGHRPVALISWRDTSLDDDALRARLAETLPRYALPVRFLVWPGELGEKGIKPSRAEAARIAREQLSR